MKRDISRPLFRGAEKDLSLMTETMRRIEYIFPRQDGGTIAGALVAQQVGGLGTGTTATPTHDVTLR